MASDGPELDLYADDIGDEFNQEYNDNDLYDDVLASNSKQRSNSNDDQQQLNGTSTQSSQNSQNNNATNNNNNASFSNTSIQSSSETNVGHSLVSSVRKPCVYIGNLTWWTTDEDLRKSLSTINVNDVIEIKFFENRANGQSKGFCVVTMQSDASVKLALEKFKQCVIHNQNPIVTLCNRQNLNNFEMKSRKTGVNGQQNQNSTSNNSNNSNNTTSNMNPNNFMQNNQRNFTMNMSSGQRPPLIQRPMRPNGPLLSSQPRLPTMSHQSMPFNSNSAQQWNQLMSNNARNNPLQTASNQLLNPMLRLNQGGRQLPNQPLLSAPSSQVDLRNQLSSVSGMAGVHNPMANPHSLFTSQSSLGANPTSDLFNSRLGLGPFALSHTTSDFTRSALDHAMALQMSEAEFEEILNKNKNLATNAISRSSIDFYMNCNLNTEELTSVPVLITQHEISLTFDHIDLNSIVII
ncbi:hypothetical protein NH340_JMT04782 [Sarcoptes scabiei]|nr:hypothetical protein NH340_JMT04782 [Sarcoptes scabiei]